MMQLSGLKKEASESNLKYTLLPVLSVQVKNMEDNFINSIVSLYKENKWQKILELNENSSSEIAKKLLWVWPNTDNLKFIQDVVKNNNLEGVISIGCGSGLFEWLLGQCTNLPVIGYEVNKEWWTSKYCCPQFIPLQFPDMPPKSEYLYSNYALLFCYFNNGPAFTQYINAYQGNLILIIGPGQDRGTYTNPEPFKANLSEQWELYGFEEVGDTKDFIAAYVKVEY